MPDSVLQPHREGKQIFVKDVSFDAKKKNKRTIIQPESYLMEGIDQGDEI